MNGKSKEAYFPQGKALFGRDRHLSECDCRRAEREMLGIRQNSLGIQRTCHTHAFMAGCLRCVCLSGLLAAVYAE